MSTAIIYFVKLPLIGYNKTRLQTLLPKEDIHHLTIHLLKKTYQELVKVDADLFAWVSPADRQDEITEYLDLQSDRIEGQIDHPHLGVRMNQAMTKIFARGYDKVILLGCDLVGVTVDLLEEVRGMLDHEDVVITPTMDGGFGIIASRQACPQMFELASYSHDEVRHQTTQKIKEAGLSFAYTRTIDDIDTREDFIRYLSGDPEAVYLNQGEYNANFLIDKGRKLLRIALGSQMNLNNQIVYEYKALKGLESSGVVPKVFDCCPQTDMIGKGYLIEEYLPGRPLNYQTDLQVAAELLARIHNVDPQQITHLIQAERPFELMHEEFVEMYRHYQEWPQRDEGVGKQIDRLMATLNCYDLDHVLANPCVINTELNAHNFLINPDQQSYVIDWEKPLIGEREQDLGHFLAPTTTLWKTAEWIRPIQIKEFVDHYNQYSKVPVDLTKLKQYLHFTCLRGITWCAMAYVQYQEAQKVKSNDQTFETIKTYLSRPFLLMIEDYIHSLEEM